ncbi:MAG TPA: SRPBCC family protein [Actinomycetota bacterium]|nr:SRPBCC family protein [Actinomycetota bacterium]
MSESEPRDGNVTGIMSKIRRGRREAAATASIPAVPTDVFRVITDVENLPRWWPRVKKAMLIDGDELGREQVLTLDWGRQEGTIRQKVVEWEPGRRYAWTVVSESADGRELPPLVKTRVTVTIERDGMSGSRVEIRAHFDPVGGRGVLALRQISRLARASYRKALRDLRGVVAPGA